MKGSLLSHNSGVYLIQKLTGHLNRITFFSVQIVIHGYHIILLLGFQNPFICLKKALIFNAINRICKLVRAIFTVKNFLNVEISQNKEKCIRFFISALPEITLTHPNMW